MRCTLDEFECYSAFGWMIPYTGLGDCRTLLNFERSVLIAVIQCLERWVKMRFVKQRALSIDWVWEGLRIFTAL